MELQQLELAGLVTAVPWKNYKIAADDNLVALHRGGGGEVSCFEADNKKKNVVAEAHKHKRSSEEVLGLGEYNQDDTDSSSLLLVWYGQPNEDDDDNRRPRKHQKPSCASFAVNNGNGERPSDRVVGWPPVESFRKKLLYQHHGPRQQPEINARRAMRKENRRSNMIPLLSGGKDETTRDGFSQEKFHEPLITFKHIQHRETCRDQFVPAQRE